MAVPKPHRKQSPHRIEIADDVLVHHTEFRKKYLNNCSSRTLARYEAQGLPSVFINGFKMTPIEAGKRWLADRITRRNPPRAAVRRGR